MKKIYLLLVTVLMSGILSNSLLAQLSDRVNSPSTFKTGTRPLAGDMGVFIGVSSEDIDNWLDLQDFTGLPLINLKYYVTDKFVARLGIQATKTKDVVKGDVDATLDAPIGRTKLEYKNLESEIKLVFGVEKHFLATNLVDVYLGAGLPLGINREVLENNVEYDNGNYNESSTSRKTILYGYDLYIGLQGFMADLPLALGIEFGLSGLGHLGNKYKHTIKSDNGAVQTDIEYFTTDAAGLGVPYTKLTATDFDLSGSARVTLTYFFKR